MNRTKRFHIMAVMTMREREIYCFIQERSECGEWTSYADCLAAGIKSPSRAISYLRRHKHIKIKHRPTKSGSLEFFIL